MSAENAAGGAPAPESAQIQQSTPAPDPTFQQPPVGSQDRPVQPDLYRQNYELRQRLETFERSQAEALQAKQNEAIQALADKGKIQEALEAERKRSTERETEYKKSLEAINNRYREEKVQALIEKSTAGRVFAGDDDATRAAQAAMLHNFLRSTIDVDVKEDGSFEIVDKESRRPASEELSRRLADKALAIYFASTSRGGTSIDGTRSPAPPQPTSTLNSNQPSTPEERVKLWRSQGHIPPLVSN